MYLIMSVSVSYRQCSDVTQPHIVQLNKLISEAQCQVILL